MSSKPATYIGGHVETGVAERVHEPDRHLVVRREHRREVGVPGEFAAGVAAEVRSPAAEDRRVQREVGVVDGVEESAHPRLGLDPVLWTRDMHDLAVSEAHEVLSRDGHR